jgi:2-methylcitrate dehydratase PrpD
MPQDTATRSESLTASLADVVLNTKWEDLSPEAITVGKQCVLDWIGVALAARNEPLVRILLEELGGEIQAPDCTLIGHKVRASLLNAALINGAMSHALDFDDVITAMGHPTVPVAPAAFALAEKLGARGDDLLLAFILGVEVECRVARYMGSSHYAKGWHGTATFGTFGATAAAAKLWGLSKTQLLHAFGLAGTQAAGLKSVFGTMSKPLHPGKAAQNGLLSARLARAGFTSDVDILASVQGFADTQSTTAKPASLLERHPRGFHVVDALFKYHAACYLTHNAIEAADHLRRAHDFAPAEIDAVRVHVQAGHLGVCNIQEPATGLEAKFSLRMTTALALSGENTFDESLFTDATANREDLVALRRRVTVEPSAKDLASRVEVLLKDGRHFEHTANVAIPVRDLPKQQEKLERKFLQLAGEVVGRNVANEIRMLVRQFEHVPTKKLLALISVNA